MVGETGPGLRERKRERTRAALVDAGRRLFEERGYDGTTVADIAAAAEIGTRTFFAYFESKEELLFPASDQRVDTALRAIAGRREGETPARVLLRAFDEATADEELTSPTAALRLRFIATVPAVQARALRMQLEAQRRISTALLDAYPELDAVEATALVGAFIGAAAGAVQALPAGDGGAERVARLRRAVARALGETAED